MLTNYKLPIEFQKPSYSVRGYNIWYKENILGLSFTKVNIPNGALSTYVIMDLKENSMYQVKIQMYSNTADMGPFSDVFEVKTATGILKML